jgi:DHA2 family multidrug resistance protein
LIAIFISEPALLIQERRALLARGLRMDYFGLFLVAIGFGALQIFLDKFELDDGFSSPVILSLGAVFTVALSTLVIWEWQHPQPVMNFRLFQVRNFAICSIIMFLMGFLFLSSTQLLPQLSQTLLGYDSETAGTSLALGGLATMLIMPVAGVITGRFVAPRYLIAFALIEMGLALLHDSQLAPNVSFYGLSMARIAQVIAIPFIFIPVSASSYIGIDPRNNGEASALLNQMRNIGGSIGISFVTTMLAWRTQFHHSRLAESITPYGSLHGMAVSQIAPIVQQQASFISYLDIFRIIGGVSLVVWPIVLFLKAPARRAT